MRSLSDLFGGSKPLEVLCIGAHCDDIEIGCGATLLRLAGERALKVTWLVLCSNPQRAAEVRASAPRFLRATRGRKLFVEGFRDGYLPAQWAEVKDRFERLKSEVQPDLIFTHERDDRHQDHRVACELTWNTFRDHVILEYEVAKYDGGLGSPGVFVPVARTFALRKARYLLASYVSQAGKRWFEEETFLSLMRLRGVECQAREGFAEAFHVRKLLV